MKRILTLLLIIASGVSCSPSKTKALAEEILQDDLILKVDSMAHAVISTGFNAGDGYREVWIRDYNTFIELAMDVMPDSLVQDNLLSFFKFQGETGDIVDGFMDKANTLKEHGYTFRYTDLEPRYGAHKNTVETDQESSLIQAVWRYVKKSGNREFLNIEVGGRRVIDRMAWALDFLMKERYNEQYGLLWGATTADWGDVQPEHWWGVVIDENSHLAIDIYDNAFFVIAINCYLDLVDDSAQKEHWTAIRETIRQNVRTHLWDEEREKFIPHIYLKDSPFPADFDESEIYYHGGTAVAIEAGLLSQDEIEASNKAMVANVEKSGAPTIGLTVYPPYPEGFFKNKGLGPYSYQNGGDWTWFGGRMIIQLIRHGFVEEAWREARPMFERVVKNQGFYEWYRHDGSPSGSGTFRGEAGVLHTCVDEFRNWAEQHN